MAKMAVKKGLKGYSENRHRLKNFFLFILHHKNCKDLKITFVYMAFSHWCYVALFKLPNNESLSIICKKKERHHIPCVSIIHYIDPRIT